MLPDAPVIEFAFDFASTASLLALKPTLALADDLGVAIEWRPFPTEAPRGVPLPKAGETVAERHARVRAEYQATDFARYAKAQGLDVRRDAVGVDSRLASLACLEARGVGVARAFVEHVFREFWAGRLDIGEREALNAALADVGGKPMSEDSEDALQAKHAEERASLSERGVHSVPAYLVADQLFLGRQHLPMIRWLLGGSEGPGPL